MAQVLMSPLIPDFDGILLQLQIDLAQRDSWTDVLTAGTGETLTEWIASVGAFNQQAIERAQQEVILDTALIPSSIYRIARMLGVHILRYSPAGVSSRLLRPLANSDAQLTIPAYTQFSIDSNYFFNRTALTFPAGQFSIDCTLYEGAVYTEIYVSSGADYQTYRIGPSDFTLSDYDLAAFVGPNSIQYSSMRDGLWHYDANQKVFYENTMPNGQVECIFGNNVYGSSPGVGDAVTFRYVITTGAAGNRPEMNLTIACGDFPILQGQTLAPVEDGDVDRGPEFYKVMAPSIYSAKLRAVTRDDYRAVACEYPTVIDALFKGQAEINPGDLRWMNIVEATLLTSKVWSKQEWVNFYNYMYNTRSIATTDMIRSDPVATPMPVTLHLYVFNRADLPTVIGLATGAVQNYFKPSLGTLGKSIWLSDIYNVVISACKDNLGPLVDYLDIRQPFNDVIVSTTGYVTLGKLLISADYATRRELTIEG